MTALPLESPMPLASPAEPIASKEQSLAIGWLVIAAVALGAAVEVKFGEFHPLAMRWLSVALLAGMVGVLGRGAAGGRRERMVLTLLFAGVLLQFFQFYTQSPTAGSFTIDQVHVFNAAIAVAEACLAVALFAERFRRPAIFALLAVYVGLGLLVLSSFRSPGVDVYLFGRDASAALLHGHNPYGVVFPNIYKNTADAERFYGPGTVIGGVLRYGYPYPPIALLVELPGTLLGDFRYAHLLAMAATGWLIATLRKDSRITIGAAALLLFTPRAFFVLEAGWVEPIAALFLAAAVWTALRAPRWLAIPLGLLLVTKQYMIFAAPAAWLLLPSIAPCKRWRIALETIAIGAAVSLPFAAIGGKRFWQSVVIWQFHQPFRSDALSYPSWVVNAFPAWAAAYHIASLAPAAGFVLATAVVGLCLWRAPRTPAGFAATVGLTLLVFFAFNKQAFCNYYYLVIAAFCTAIAAAGNSI